MATVLMVGGGSVGHIAPAVAVWEAFQKKFPGSNVHFVCSNRPDDAAFLRATKLPFSVLRAPRVSPLFLITFVHAVLAAQKILKTHKPDIIFSKGGYVSVPVCFAAMLKKIPIVLHESDAVGGYANRLIGHFAQAVCEGFPGDIPTHHHRYTGNPVRAMVTSGDRDRGLAITGFSGLQPILLIIGGSQGAQPVNDIIALLLTDLLKEVDIIHITGRGKSTVSNQQLATHHYYTTEFVTDDLPHLYACATLALSRAGAGSIAELAANAIPTILVPLRGVGHDHQWNNAKAAEASGGCIVLEQQMLSTKLIPIIREILHDTERRESLQRQISKLHVPDAPVRIAETIANCLDQKANAQ